MLRTRTWKSSSLRLLNESDRDEALAICDRDPVANVFVSARLRSSGLDPGRLGAQLWGYSDSGRLASLCYSGANLVPVEATPAAILAFAGRARLQGRRCSSMVGPAEVVTELWGMLAPYWGRPREIRARQPVMTISGEPAVPPDPLVRQVRPDELDILLPASVDMFTEEVGVSPIGPDGGAAYRARVLELIRPAGRSRGSRTAGSSSRPRSARSPRTPARCRASGCRRTCAAGASRRAVWPRSRRSRWPASRRW